MGREVPPESARLRTAGLEAPRLAKLNASGSPCTSPTAARAYRSPMGSFKLDSCQLATAGVEPDNGAGTAPPAGAWGVAATHQPGGVRRGAAPSTAGADWPGGDSDEADPGFLQMLAATLPTQSDGDGSGPEDSRVAAAAATGAVSMPDTIARLAALSASPTAARAAAHDGHAAATNGDAGGKNHKRGGFIGLFRAHSDKLEKQHKAAAAEMGRIAGSESSSSGDGGKKKGKKRSSWFGGSSKAARAAGGKQPDAAIQRGGSGVLLPGLPLTELSATGRRHSEHSLGGSSTADGSGATAEEGSPAAAALGARPAGGALPAGTPLASGLADFSASGPSAFSTAPPVLGLPPATDLVAAAAAAAAAKPNHRRQRSLTSLIASGWRRRSRTASAGSESELGGTVTPAHQSNGNSRAGSPAPLVAQALASGFALTASPSTEVAGVPPAIAEEPPLPLLPPGLTGIRNIGNTCFVNAALQCLRYTPGLALQVVPDLLEQAALREHAKQGGAGGDAAAAVGAAGSGLAAAAEDAHQLAMARVSSDLTHVAQQVRQQAQQQEPAAASAEPAAGAEAAPAAAAAAEGAAEPAPAVAAAEADAGEGPSTDGQAPASTDPQGAGEQGQQQPQNIQQHAEIEQQEQQPADDEHETQQQQQQQEQGQPPQQQAGTAVKPQRPPRGALLQAFAEVVRNLYLPPPSAGSSVCATPLLRTLRAFPIAADYFDGGQHDCQEVLRVLMDLLHEDMNRVQRPQQQQQDAVQGDQPQDGTAAREEQPADASGEEASKASTAAAAAVAAAATAQEARLQEQPSEGGDKAREGPSKDREEQDGPEAEDEAAKADRIWEQQLERDSSAITDLFGGQLQSSVTCHKCGGRFTMYEPFWDLSLPLAKEGKGGGLSWLGLKGTPASIQDCLTAFTADEKLEGVEAFHCEKCGEKTPATKHLRIHRFPEVLVLQIKRFKYKGTSTDKLTANVSFPLKDLRLHQFASPESPASSAECCYELYAVSNHYGNLSGGHYTAMCRVPQPGGGDAWFSFNDEQVTRVSPSQVTSQYAYILFYVRSRSSSVAAAAAEASRSHHRRTASAASAGAGGGSNA